MRPASLGLFGVRNRVKPCVLSPCLSHGGEVQPRVLKVLLYPDTRAPPLRSDAPLDLRGGEGGGHEKKAFGNSVHKRIC